jgi:hypothetical protein
MQGARETTVRIEKYDALPCGHGREIARYKMLLRMSAGALSATAPYGQGALIAGILEALGEEYIPRCSDCGINREEMKTEQAIESLTGAIYTPADPVCCKPCEECEGRGWVECGNELDAPRSMDCPSCHPE